MSQEAYDKAMEELETIEKSQAEETSQQDELDALTKSLEEELKEDDLQKSKDGDADDKNGDSDPDEDEGGEPDEDEFEKSDDNGFDDELVKASEAYASLEKSVFEFGGSVHEELDSIKKSLAANMNLNIKMAKVIAGLAKSLPEIETITKSVEELAKQPTSPNRAVLGVGGSSGDEQKIEKSVAEITELLTKSVSAGHIDARHLSIFGTYKDVNRIPKEVQTIIGL